MGRIEINSQGLKENAGRLKANADVYDQELKKIKAAVEELRPYWTDAAGQQFFEKFEAKYNIVDGMGQAIRDLGDAVDRTAKRFDDSINTSMGQFN